MVSENTNQFINNAIQRFIKKIILNYQINKIKIKKNYY